MKAALAISLFGAFWGPMLGRSRNSLTLVLKADVLFRIEEDRNGLLSDGTPNEDRTLIRVRARIGLDGRRGPVSAGIRIRTGTGLDQQDPNITLGGPSPEQGPFPISIDRAFVRFSKGRFYAWGGKEVYPFFKLDELFWSDHVCPEGLFAGVHVGNGTEEHGGRLSIQGGHFIIRASNASLGDDASLSAGQLWWRWHRPKLALELAPGFFHFANMPVVPDRPDTTRFDHLIVQGQYRLLWKKGRGIALAGEHTLNLDPPDGLAVSALDGQGFGTAFHVTYGKLKSRGDYQIGYSWCRLEKFSGIDYLAQNDWARWDYSQLDSPDGSLTNMQGHRVSLAWMPLNGLKLALIGYAVERIVREGIARQRGDRVRFDVVYTF